jgi:hypothetical protein
MVNSISGVTAAADTRVTECRLATGAFMAGRVDVAHQRPSGALTFVRPPVFARPRAIQGTGVSGYGRAAVAFGLPQGQPSVRKQYPNQARSAVASGGALGPLPPRDPV